MYFPNDASRGTTNRRGVVPEGLSIFIASAFPLSRLRADIEAWLQVIDAPRCRVEAVEITSPVRYLLDRQHRVCGDRRGFHVVLFRLEDWNGIAPLPGERHGGLDPASCKLIECNLARMKEALHSVADPCFGTTLIVTLPLSRPDREDKNVKRYFSDVRGQLADVIAGYPQYCFFDAGDIAPRTGDEEDQPEGSRLFQGDAFFDQLAKQIVRTCYSAESRPWQGLIVAPDAMAESDRPHWPDFINSQWRAGRTVALATQARVDEAAIYAEADAEPDGVAEKFQRLAQRLLLPPQDLIFAGSAPHCADVEKHFSQALVLPVLDERPDCLAVLVELWCLDRIPELWLTEPHSVAELLPRLSAQAQMRLATHPRFRAVDFLRGSPGQSS